MLETLLEQLLLRFLTPYVEGMSRDRLRLGVWSGEVELKDLRVKSDAFTNFGNHTLRVKTGHLGRLHLSVPWQRLYSGKVAVVVEGLDCEVERIIDSTSQKEVPDAEVVAQMREAKRKAIDARVLQLKDLVKQQEQEEEQGESPANKGGFFAKLVRKILQNLHISVQVARCAYSSPASGLGVSLEMQALEVVSTDSTYKEHASDPMEKQSSGPLAQDDGSLYKLLRLKRLGLRMSPAGSAEISEAQYVLHPVSANLKLAHDPAKGTLTTSFEMAREDLLELTLIRSSVKHLRSGQVASGAKAARLHKLMVPPAEEETIFQDVNVSMQEYGDLYERQFVAASRAEKKLREDAEAFELEDKPLDSSEQRRMRLLEDALSVRLLARRRLLVQERLQALKALHKAAHTGATAAGSRVAGICTASFAKSVWKRLSAAWAVLVARRGIKMAVRAAAVSSNDEDSTPLAGQHDHNAPVRLKTRRKNVVDMWLDPSEKQRIMRDINDDAKFQRVDIPQRMRFEFQLGMLALDLLDDRWSKEEDRQLLSLALENAHLAFNLHFATDYHGRDSAEWSLEIRLGKFHAFHGGHTVFKFLEPEKDINSASSPKTIRRRSTVALAKKLPNAARLVIASELGRDENVLQLLFDFAPTQLHLHQGIVEEIRDFIKAPPPPPESEAMVAVASAKDLAEKRASSQDLDDEALALAAAEAELPASPAKRKLRRTVVEVLEGKEHTAAVAEILADRLPKTVGNRERAESVAKKVYERIPDKLKLSVKIASPTFFVPVPGQGTTIFSLGLLEIKTPQPCKYTDLYIHCELDDMVLCSTTIRGEHFDMFQPVMIGVKIHYSSDEEGSSVVVGVEAERLSLSLAPQAMQMLLATPLAIAGVLSQKERPEAPPPEVGQTLPPPAEEDSEVPIEPPVHGYDHEEEEQVAPAEKKQMKLSVTVAIDKLKLTLLDSVVPVIVLRMQWLPPGLEIYKEREPCPYMTIDMIYTLEAEILNPRNNAWEPLIERFHGGLQLVKHSQVSESLTRIVISGREQVLMNLKPTTLQHFTWFLPMFLKGLTFSKELVVTAASDSADSDVSSKYRVVNLCSEALELEFISCHKSGLVTRVEPTGSRWELLDKWMKSPYFATALMVRVPGGRNSEQLVLEHNGAVAVPDCSMVAQLLTPSPSDHTQHRMLLLSAPVKLHNQTSLTLHVRFHAVDGENSEVLEINSPPTSYCDAALLGHFPPEDLVKLGGPSETAVGRDSISPGIMVLPPNAMASVPSPALMREQGGDVCLSHLWLSARPANGNSEFSKVVEAGAHVETSSLRCPRASSRSEDVFLVCRSVVQTAQLPHPLPLPTVALQPPLTLVNAVPAMEGLVVECGATRRLERGSAWRGVLKAAVPPFARVHLYGLPGVMPQDGTCLRVRLGPGGPWSAPLHLEPALFQAAGETGCAEHHPKHLELRQRPHGAAAGLVVEALDALDLRLSCPYWFVDRSGLPANLGLGISVKGAPLPRSGGITLLHANCLEEECDVVLGGAPMSTSDCGLLPQHPWCCTAMGHMDHATFCMPPNWSVLTLPSSLGRFTFCVQTEDVTCADVLGATCQVVTLRPRLIITNASTEDVELISPAGATAAEMESLPAGGSREWHRSFEGADSDPPTTSLRFRPCDAEGQPVCQWSGLVVCSDPAAGSTPFLLAPENSTGIRRTPQVWSVELAPSRGALSLSLRKGSDFVAVNKATRTRATMLIHPMGGDSDHKVELPVPPGQEVPYGWPQPLQGNRKREVEVVVNGRFKVHLLDVRRTHRQLVKGLRLEVAVARVGSRTVLSLEDAEVYGQKKAAAECHSTLQLELKLARLGLSLVEEVPQPRELFFLRLDLIRLEWQRKSELDIQSIKMMISDAQVDCQLPNRQDPGQHPPGETPKSLGLLRREEKPGVLLANCAIGDRPFLRLMLERGATSSRDLVLSQAEVALDALDVVVDDGWLEGLMRFLSQCRSPGTGRGLRFHAVEEMAGKSVVEGYEPPPLPSIIQVERLQISSVKLTLWCWLKLRSTLGFLPPYIQQALRVLSFSDELTLEDATLSLPERNVLPHRGSLGDFLRGLASEYTMNLIKNVGVVLGKSSLLNLPRVPMKIGSSAVSYLTEGMGLVAGEAASLLNQLTFDDEYVSRQRRIRSEKHIRNAADGLAEAGRALGEGLEGVLDVVKKPAEGWRSHGLGGAVVGVGQGIASGVFKPLAHVGQAMSDIGSGISVQMAPETAGTRRLRARPRSRRPRLLFSAGAAIRPWSEMEAELQQRLGSGPLRGIEEVLEVDNRNRRRALLLLFGDRLAVCRMELAEGHESEAGENDMGKAPRGSTGSASSGHPGTFASNVRPNSSFTRGVDLLGALEESTTKILSQTLKPLKGLVNDVQDIGREALRFGRDNADAQDFDPGMNVQVLPFSRLWDVTFFEDPRMLQFIVESSRGEQDSLNLVLNAPLSHSATTGLVMGLKSAVQHPDSQANWAELRAALREEHRERRERLATANDLVIQPFSDSAGTRTLEVYEVERWKMMTGSWVTPFMPIDKDLSWRWVDATGKRHPHLDAKLTRDEAQRLREPPCELNDLFKPTDKWSIETADERYPDGWRYGLAWRSSTWDVTPGIFDLLRRRKWLRTFT